MLSGTVFFQKSEQFRKPFLFYVPGCSGVWVVHMDSEILDRTFLRLCERYLERPGSEELLLAPLEQTAYGTM